MAEIAEQTHHNWRNRSPEYAQASETALAWGFARHIEGNIYQIADDFSHRGQMRALELIAKARAPEYQDKRGIDITLIQGAAQAEGAITGQWTEGKRAPEQLSEPTG